MSATVTYKGATLTTVNNQTRTLQTSGTWLEGDITITDVTAGGATDMVKGSFTTSSTSGAQTISIPYTGSGYPVALMIWVDGGCYDSSNTTWYNSTARYTIGEYCMTKSVESSTPTYTTSGSQNQGVVCYIYKNSTSNATTYQRSSTMTQNIYTSNNPGNQGSNCVAFKSKTSLEVYVRGSSNYGFMPGLTYKYLVLYSS